MLKRLDKLRLRIKRVYVSQARLAQCMRGFTLMEMLIALALMSLVILGVSRVYVGVKSGYVDQQAWLQIAQRAGLAAMYLGTVVRQAGDDGCDQRPVLPAVAVHAPDEYMSRYLQRNQQKDSDALTISACRVHKGKEQFISTSYFVAKTSRKDARGDPIYALYEKIGVSPRLELVDHVDDLRVSYAVLDAKTQRLHWQPVGDGIVFKDIVAVSLELLFRESVRGSHAGRYWYAHTWHASAQGSVHLSLPLIVFIRHQALSHAM